MTSRTTPSPPSGATAGALQEPSPRPAAAPEAAPRFAVLGPVEVTTADGEAAAPAGRKQRELLALLLLRRNRPSSADRLAADLWGGAAPKGAEVTLRSHVSHLRRWLSQAGVGDVLGTGPAGYRLAIPPGQLDTDRFEALAGRGQEALGLGDPRRAVADLRAALALWRGQPYAELQEVEAASGEATRLEEVHLVALETVAAAELAAGRHREVVGELQQLVAEHPFREKFAALLMVAMYRSGRQADALAAYESTRERLAEELGLDPGPELRGLAQAVLRQDPVVLGDAPPPPRRAAGAAREAQPDQPPQSHRAANGPPDAVLAAAAKVPLAGRAAQTRQLDAAWDAVVEGGRRLLLLSGEAGIGKTRLTAGLVARVAGQGHPVLVGRCEDAGLPYHPVVAALRSSAAVDPAAADAPAPVRAAIDLLLGGAPQPTSTRSAEPEDEQRLALYAAVAFVLGRLADDRPLLVVVENAERIDRASSLMLRHLIDRLPEATAVVVSYRDPPGGRHLPLLELLGDAVPRDLTERVPLGPLAEPEMADLVRSVLPDADEELVRRVWQHTGGNPYFATELTRARAAAGRADRAADSESWPVPSGVRDVLRHRLLQLGEPAREALAGAAVLGADVDFALLAEVLQGGEEQVADAVDEAVSAGLLVESGRSWAGRYAFPHELMREAVLADLPAARSRRLHLQAARALAAQPALGGGGASAVVLHLRRAGPAADPAETVEWSWRAAGEASAVYAWDEAVEYADGAVDLLARASPGRGLAEAAVRAAALRLRSSRGFDRAVRLLETALRAYLDVGDEAGAGRVHSRLGAALCLHHSVMDIPRALDHFEAAERLLTEPDKSFYVNRGRAQAAMFGLRTETLRRSADRAAGLAGQMGRRDLAVTAAWGQAWAAVNEGRLAEADEVLEQAWGTAHELADPYLGWISVNMAAMVANVYVLDPATARTWCRRGLRQPRFTSFAFNHDTVVDQLVLALAASGELLAAREAVATLPSDAVARRVVTFLDGDWERAETEWAAALARDEAAGDLHDAALNARWLAAARQALGDRAGVADALDRALALGRAGPQLPTELAARAELAQLLARDDLAAAQGHLARCEQILAAGADWRGSAGQVELAGAVVAEAGGDRGRADAQLGRAVDNFTSYGLPWHRAAALGAWSRLLARRGEAGQAAVRRHQAEQVYADLGAVDRWLTPRADR